MNAHVYINDDKNLFDYLYSNKEEIEDEMNMSLDWKRLDDKKASKIEITHENIDILDQYNWDKMKKMHINDAKKLYSVFNPLINDYVQKTKSQ